MMSNASPTRDADAARSFFLKALPLPTCSASQASWIEEQTVQSSRTDTLKVSKPTPRVINVETNAASPKAMADLKAARVLLESVELRQVKYLNNLGEHDHRFIVCASPTVHSTWWVPVTYSTPPVL